MGGTLERCAYCPQLCRHVCPVAVATGHEAATPARILATVLLARRGRVPPEDAARAAALCTDCGACQRHCKHGVEVPRILAEARATFAQPAVVSPIAMPEGAGTLVAVECDGRHWAPALARALDQPVARLVTTDHLGEAVLWNRARAAAHLTRVHAALVGRKVVSGCSRCLAVLDAAHVQRVRPEALLGTAWSGPVYLCHGQADLPGDRLSDAPVCCGAHGPLPLEHPTLAAEVAREAAAKLPPGPTATPDSACRNALRDAGANVVDPIDLLLESPSRAAP